MAANSSTVMVKSSEEILNELSRVSPLALPQALISYEVCDMQSSQKILDDIYKEFGDGAGSKKAFIEPIGLALCDGLIKALDEKAKKYGLTASNLYKEIDSFSYESTENSSESEQIIDPNTDIHDSDLGNYDREKVVNNSKLKSFVEETLKQKGSVKDDYQPTNKGIKDKKSDKWRKRNNMDVDHAVSAKKVYDQVNLFAYAPTDPEERKRYIRDVANMSDNLRNTSASLNRKKQDAHNVNYVFNNWNGLKPETRNAMLMEGARAQTNVASKMAFGVSAKDVVDVKNLKDVKDTAEKLKGSGAHAVVNEQLGKIISTVLAPIWYEVREIAMKGVCHEMDTDNWTVAVGHRFKRVFKYILKRLPGMLKAFFEDIGAMIIDLIKSIITSLFKKALFVIKEGIGILIQAFKILLAPADKMTAAEKGDAILKIIASVIPALLIDIGLSAALKPYFTWWPKGADVAAGVISSLVAAVLAYLLDKLDLFSAKREKRIARINEIFDARIQSIKESTANFNIAVRQRLIKDREHFENLKQSMSNALDLGDMEKLNLLLDKTADFFQIKIPYASTEEFIKYIQTKEHVYISSN